MSDETWDSHDRNTGAFCRTCGDDSFVCATCINKDVTRLEAENAKLRAALEVCKATIPHMDGNPMSTYSLVARVSAALLPPEDSTDGK